MYAGFLYIHERIDRFLDTVSPVESYTNNPARRFQLILVHCLANFATINLNVSPSWTCKSVDAATKIVHLLDSFELREIRFVHPIMGVSNSLTRFSPYVLTSLWAAYLGGVRRCPCCSTFTSSGLCRGKSRIGETRGNVE